MSDGNAVFAHTRHVQAITAKTPEALATLLRKIIVPVDILGFTAAPGVHTCYIRSVHRIKVVNGNVTKAPRLSPIYGGEP